MGGMTGGVEGEGQGVPFIPERRITHPHMYVLALLSSLFPPSLIPLKITNPPRSTGKDVTELHRFVTDVVTRINNKYSTADGYQPVRIVWNASLYGKCGVRGGESRRVPVVE